MRFCAFIDDRDQIGGVVSEIKPHEVASIDQTDKIDWHGDAPRDAQASLSEVRKTTQFGIKHTDFAKWGIARPPRLRKIDIRRIVERRQKAKGK